MSKVHVYLKLLLLYCYILSYLNIKPHHKIVNIHQLKNVGLLFRYCNCVQSVCL